MPEKFLKPEETFAIRKWIEEDLGLPLENATHKTKSGEIQQVWYTSINEEPVIFVVNIDSEYLPFLHSKFRCSTAHAQEIERLGLSSFAEEESQD